MIIYYNSTYSIRHPTNKKMLHYYAKHSTMLAVSDKVKFLNHGKAVVFCKVGLRTLQPEISENLNKNKNEITVFLFPPTQEKAQGFIFITSGAYAARHWKNDQC